MKTKLEALNFAKQNNITIKQFKNNDEQGYLIGTEKIIYCGYGNMFSKPNSPFGQKLGDILFAEINKQLN